MANFKTFNTFELTDLNISDVKSAKSVTDKLYFSRIKREINIKKEYLERDWDKRAALDKMTLNKFTDEFIGYGYLKSKEKIAELLEENIKEYIDEINALENQLSLPMPENEWLLWFAFDEQAVKVFGKEAKDLYNLLSDKANHNIRGEASIGGNSIKIINWQEL